ncbi:hypothetical protein HNY73_003653 [Argiope bruennichi]|uniref:Uncharacterized protein n=1 Tax=Argiope bruennichi TaxID=94029 RepID=A0A8T0FLU5_ARGBR|nr:hypothetical protein HNY73_003653 [Argiope bruennichi]
MGLRRVFINEGVIPSLEHGIIKGGVHLSLSVYHWGGSSGAMRKKISSAANGWGQGEGVCGYPDFCSVSLDARASVVFRSHATSAPE